MMKSVSAWKQELSSGAHAARLAALYCCAPDETPAQAARYEAVLNGLDATFGPHAEAGPPAAPRSAATTPTTSMAAFWPAA